MDSQNPQAWHEIFSVGGTAAAALLGLVLVAVSLHVREVEKHPLLRQRARTSIQILGLYLFIAIAALLPHLNGFWFGIAIVGANAVYLVVLLRSVLGTRRVGSGIPPIVWLRLSANVLSLISVAAGISLIIGEGPGLYLLAPALTLVLPLSLYNVWLLLFARELQQD
jgi:hypothetical protein